VCLCVWFNRATIFHLHLGCNHRVTVIAHQIYDSRRIATVTDHAVIHLQSWSLTTYCRNWVIPAGDERHIDIDIDVDVTVQVALCRLNSLLL